MIYKIDRDYEIWQDYLAGVSQKEIGMLNDCSKAAVQRTIYKLRKIGDKKRVEQWFRMAFIIRDLLLDMGENPDHYASRVATALFVYGYTTPAKIRKVKDDDWNAFLVSKRMRMVGYAAWDALDTIRKSEK